MASLVRQSVLAGILVGIGVVVNISSENRYVGAMLFSFALLAIIKCGFKLYTGKIGFYPDPGAGDLALMLIFNLIGVLFPTLGIAFCRPAAYEAIMASSAVKFANSFPALFLYGTFCGILMFLAVYAKDTVITVFCIMIFILSGFEHCIADFCYLILNFSPENCFKFLGIVFGNSAGSVFARFLAREGKR